MEMEPKEYIGLFKRKHFISYTIILLVNKSWEGNQGHLVVIQAVCVKQQRPVESKSTFTSLESPTLLATCSARRNRNAARSL